MVQERSGLILGLNSGRVRFDSYLPMLLGLLKFPQDLSVQSIGSFKATRAAVRKENTRILRQEGLQFQEQLSKKNSRGKIEDMMDNF